MIGEVKTRRLAELCTQADVVVAADSAVGVAQLAAAARAAGSSPRVVIEVDVGMGRCGVAPGAGVVRLAQEVAARV